MYLKEYNGLYILSNNSKNGEKICDHRNTKFQNFILNKIDKDNSNWFGRRITYSVGDCLRLPRIYYRNHKVPVLPDGDARARPLPARPMREVVSIVKNNIWKDSLLYKYYLDIDMDECQPNMQRFINIVDDMDYSNFDVKIFDTIKETGTLVCHIRTGDCGNLEKETLSQLQKLRSQFDVCLICLGMEWSDAPGLYWDRHGDKKDDIIKHFFTTCSQLLCSLGDNTSIIKAEPDYHICMFRHSKNLFVHKGGFSCIGSLICKGNIYCSKEFVPFSNEKNKLWRSMVIGKILSA